MNTDLRTQHELLKTALEATDNYLFYEKRAKEAGIATSQDVHNFSYEMSRAHDALQSLGVLDQHQDYMKFHVGVMMKLLNHDDSTLSDLPYAHVPQSDVGEVEEETQVWDKPSPVKNSKKLSPAQKAKAKARASAAGRPYPNMVDNIWAARQESTLVSFSSFLKEEYQKKSEEQSISEEEINEIVDSIDWEDVVDLYDDTELVEVESEEEEEVKEEVIQEKLSAQTRLRKKQAFARYKGRRNIAKTLKLRRSSSMEVLKKRAVVAARRAMYKRFLRGRNKSTLSAAEKDRIEQQVARMKNYQSVIAMKMLPHLRSIEQKRIANIRRGKR